MPLILSIETATTVCSVALHDNNELLGSQSLFIDKSHSGLLAPSIKSLVEYCGYTINDLSAVAVSEGPGSYTGLRIGVSAAKGLCFSLDIPLIAVSTLEAMARGVNKYNHGQAMLCPMIDARRMEVYCLLVNAQKDIVSETRPVVIDESSFQEQLSVHKILFFGNGATKCKGVIKSDNAVFIDHVFPDAIHIGAIAAEKFQKSQFENVAYFEPFYLKDFRISQPKSR
ncbi:putative molecular chaperone [Fulvivirga imtechensis AK7]|uniref:Putative molecular chaperone n=1 Tax=Fulvivirga imtechensis AK7 TaxID=1237149 RepID=L8JQA2_9BACT|nr:tRNA (adenosine(37)-N6)-threonylcarbamoyltransferase complex dimerization subunit type 1 TsaB [Fulvivirga imtechensis]ELR69557.1 putative molecular chaperone [Fulvivirga imtechensis AK7]